MVTVACAKDFTLIHQDGLLAQSGGEGTPSGCFRSGRLNGCPAVPRCRWKGHTKKGTHKEGATLLEAFNLAEPLDSLQSHSQYYLSS